MFIHLGNETGDREEPSTSRAESTKLISISNVGKCCIFCKKEFGENEKVPQITENGLNSLIAACTARNDAIGATIKGASKKGYKKCPFKYHNSCREQYANQKNIAILNKRKLEPPDTNRGNDTPPSTKRISRGAIPEFYWNNHCFICNQVKDNNKTGCKFSLVDMNPESMSANVLKAAKERNDVIMINRMPFDCLFEVNARYHSDCLAKYLSPKNIEAYKKSQTVRNTIELH